MSLMPRSRRNPVKVPTVLVVDDDRRVVELLEIAFGAHGFSVLTAADGEEALRKATSNRPDLMVLDVRLPRRSGLEVCEILRRDPDESHLPIILVSAAAETDARLRGLACGADDYMAKPFSPKELIARVKRLLARTAEAAESRRRTTELQRELVRAKNEMRRSHVEAKHEARLREVTVGPGRDLQRTLDVDEVVHRFIVTVQARFGLEMVGVLVLEPGEPVLTPRAVRGDTLDRLAGMAFVHSGELARIVSGLARPVTRGELESLRELRDEVSPLVACGIHLVAPLRGPDGLEALLVAEERHDGRALDRGERNELGGLCEMAAIALHNAQQIRAQTSALIRTATRVQAGDVARTSRDEARGLVARAARACFMMPRQRELLDEGVLLELGGDGDHASIAALEALVPFDPTGRVNELVELGRRAAAIAAHAPAGAPPTATPDLTMPDERRAALLLYLAKRYGTARAEGAAPSEALVDATVQAGCALDPSTAQALNGSFREPLAH